MIKGETKVFNAPFTMKDMMEVKNGELNEWIENVKLNTEGLTDGQRRVRDFLLSLTPEEKDYLLNSILISVVLEGDSFMFIGSNGDDSMGCKGYSQDETIYPEIWSQLIKAVRVSVSDKKLLERLFNDNYDQSMTVKLLFSETLFNGTEGDVDGMVSFD